MLCASILGPTFQEASQQISQALEHADLVELRLDRFERLDLAALQALLQQFPIPMIFALRSVSQGGSYPFSEEKRLEDIALLATLEPDYFDLELSTVPSVSTARYSGIKWIVSYHDFEGIPDDLDQIYQKMCRYDAHYYKICVTPANTTETLRFLCWAKGKEKTIAIGMGGHGQISRIIAPVLGFPMTYAGLDDHQTAAPGQLSLQSLVERYRYKTLNGATVLYGLIGDPVDQSPSPITHNHFMKESGFNAVYLAMQVTLPELSSFLELLKQLPFRGLSITMPLKEAILDYLDEIDPIAKEIGAVNTLVIDQGQMKGYNTDAEGALNALESTFPVRDKHCLILGAGGSAKAVANEAVRRGAVVTVLNRDGEKALQLASRLRCRGYGIENMGACANQGYDVLINCTPVPMPIDPNDILPKTVVMDLKIRPKETEFLKHALAKQCQVVYGEAMFFEQAAGQFALWFQTQHEEKR